MPSSHTGLHAEPRPDSRDEVVPAGTPVAVYGTHKPLFGISTGPMAPSLRSDRTRQGVLVEGAKTPRAFSPQVVVPRAEFDTAWHVFLGSRIVAGGPTICRARADEIAAALGADLGVGVSVQQGAGTPVR